MITIVNRTQTDLGVYIGRPSILSNPFEIGKDGTRGEVIKKYREYFYNKLETSDVFRREVLKLIDVARKGDLKLACWCAPAPCHGSIIKEYIESVLAQDQFESIFN